MNRTRKWKYMAQEAGRLAELGFSSGAIAQRLGVRPSTVRRWMAAGKLRDTRHTPRGAAPVVAASWASWAPAVRAAYALDVSDDQLVTLAEAALMVAHDLTQSPIVRLNAAGRFQALIKQLALIARQDDAAQPLEAITHPHRADPRAQFAIVR
jgi:hypothetical protein